MSKESFLTFFKKYGYYCIAGLLVIAIAVTVVLATSNKEKPLQVTPGDDIVDVNTQAISWSLPMNDFTVLKAFSDSELQYNQTLNQWESHKSYDLTSSDLSVYTVANGTVTSVEQDYLLGTKVTITHNDGFVTCYASLDPDVDVKTGDVVEKGQQIGQASDSAESESEDGKHLHFEMFKNGSKVDPSNYLNLSNK